MKRERIHGYTLSPFCWTVEPTSLFFWQTQTCWQKTTGDNLSVGFLYYKKVYIGAEPLTLVPNSRTYFLIILLLEYSVQWTRNFSHQCGTTRKYIQRNNHSHYFWITAPTSLCFCNIQPNWHKITGNHVAVGLLSDKKVYTRIKPFTLLPNFRDMTLTFHHQPPFTTYKELLAASGEITRQ